MRSKRYKSENKKEINKRNKHLIPNKPALTVLLFITLLVSIIFVGMLITVNAFPAKYMVILLLLIAVMMVVIIKLLNCRKKKTKQRKAGIILSVLMILCLCVGTYYLYSTYSMFNKISGDASMTEDFHVVVLADSSYESVGDIKGKKLFVTTGESGTYKEAKGKLMSEAGVTYEEAGDYLATGNKLIDEEGKTHDEIIFISNTNYEVMCEETGGFRKQTKIIYTVTVDIEANDIAKRVDVTKEPFNIYISGIDTFGSINKVARSDVNMIMTVNPVTKEILLTSIPRDSYVALHTYGAMDKLTHSGIYGVEETVTTVEDWLGIDINYYLRVNFTTLVDIVDIIGGIDVESEYAFSSSVSDYSYVAGTNHLNGESALYFSRERKSLSSGDNERVKNQQRVMKGIINKITTSPVILTKYTQLLDAVGDKMQTNMDDSDMSALVRMQLDDLGGWTIKTNSIEGTGSKGATYSMGSRELYIMIPNEESVTSAQIEINKVLYPQKKTNQ